MRATEFTIGAPARARCPASCRRPRPTPTRSSIRSTRPTSSARPTCGSPSRSSPTSTTSSNFPAGTPVPPGYYDRAAGQWVAAPGRRRHQDRRRSGGARRQIGGRRWRSTTPSAAKLATLYAPGKTLWRVAVTHFTPWDYNYPYGPPDGAGPPGEGGPNGPDPRQRRATPAARSSAARPDARRADGDLGTPFTLALLVRSRARPAQRAAARHPADPGEPAGGDGRVDLSVEVAGVDDHQAFDRGANLNDDVHLGRQGRLRAPDPGPSAGRREDQLRLPGGLPRAGRVRRLLRRRSAAPCCPPTDAPGDLGRPAVDGLVGGLHAPPRPRPAGASTSTTPTIRSGSTLYVGDGSKRCADGQNFDVIPRRRRAAREGASGNAPEGMATTPDGARSVAEPART